VTAQDKNSRRARGHLRDEVLDSLRETLIAGRIVPGAYISEPQLAESLNTSRSPIREALCRLEAEGFVERTDTGRVRAVDMDMSELEQLYELRGALEGLAVKLATPRVTMQDLDEMAETISRMEKCCNTGDLKASLEAGEAFHAAIRARCANAPLVRMLEWVLLQIRRFRSIIATTRPQDIRASEHRAVLQAMLDRDPEKAESEMVRHIVASAKSVSEAVTKAEAAGTLDKTSTPSQGASSGARDASQ
jgi:DNA-binding GntR family transcriptional regulator